MKWIRRSRMALVLLAALGLFDLNTADRAEAAVRRRTPPDLFYNFYVPPCGDPSVGAQLYVSPRPVPPRVGHTYVTYEPLMPHEFLYKHYRTYRRYNPGAGWTKTCVWWH